MGIRPNKLWGSGSDSSMQLSGTKGLFGYYRNKFEDMLKSLSRIEGLNPDYNYELLENNTVFGGDELMNVGVNLPYVMKDYDSLMWRFKKV